MKKSLYFLVLIFILGFGFWYWRLQSPDVISSDTVVKGDYAVEKGKHVAIAKGAILTIEGNFDIRGKLSCEDGPLRVIVRDNFNLSGEIACDDGDVQLVERSGLLATTPEEIGKLYEEAAKDSGEGQSIGPLEDKGESTSFSPHNTFLTRPDEEKNKSRGLIPKASASSHTVVVSGKFAVGTPSEGVKRIVVFNFPTAAGMEIRNLELTGPDGRAGADDKAAGCSARGKDGEDAFRFLAYAGNMTVNNFTLKLGSGGKGGDAETTKNCDPGVAIGGAGGKSGNFKMVAGNEFKITGAFIIEPGKGGEAGSAKAYGKDGGPTEKGGDATSTGGAGAHNKKALGIRGNVAGTENVQIGSMVGGKGGDALAAPGKGGDGIGCKSNGGPGGNASATGGRGGDASLALSAGASRVSGARDVGGDGGSADATAAKAGDGGDCGPEDAGGNGGKGGDATAKPGAGGVGKTSNGQDGKNINEIGGNGGNGGDGCPEGAGGKGGKGNPPGKDGDPGKNLCVEIGKDAETSLPDDAANVDTEPNPSPTPQGQKIQAIQYNGKYIPIANQLHVEPGHGTDPTRSCPQDHWHSFEGIVVATDKTQIIEPQDPCGFGIISQRPVVEVEI